MENEKIYINESKVSEILLLISKAIHQPVLFYNTANKQWICSTQKNRPFCYVLERNPTTNYYCFKCDKSTDEKCTKTHEPFSYYCHAGLLEIACPVWINEIYAGYITVGQYRTRKHPIDESYLRKLAEICKIDYNYILKKYMSHQIIGVSTIEGLKLISSLCAKHLLDAGVFSVKDQHSINKIEQYVQAHISEPLTLEDISNHVYMNPSYLSSYFKKHTGISLSLYIQQQRITAACRLIRVSSQSFEQIAYQTGFKDTNYFGKVFKKIKDMTPGEYRYKWKNGKLYANDSIKE